MRALTLAGALAVLGLAGWWGVKLARRPEPPVQPAAVVAPSAPTHEPERQAPETRIIVGFDDPEQLRQLLSKYHLAGVFITQKNVRGKSKEEVRQMIASFQALRREQGLAPLVIAADQEGGLVEKLSPPLVQRPPLAEVIKRAGAQWEIAVRDYAASQAGELKELGVTMNLAPVVDLDPGKAYPGDRFTRISKRAFSADEQVVAGAASIYTQEMLKAGVTPTLKHFPGLRLVSQDTHLRSAELDVELKELRNKDWLPYQQVLTDGVALMVAHVKLVQLDADNPVSYSARVVKEIIRGELGFKGLIISDDLTMAAVTASRDGVGGAAVKALDAGVDLLLLAFKPELLEEVLLAFDR